MSESNRLRFDAYEIDLHTQELWKFGTRLRLVGQPFAILAMLLKRPGELVTREELHNHLWASDTFVDFNHGLHAAVNKLRETLSDSAEDPKYIETLPRRGYRFIGKLEPAVKPAATRGEESSPTGEISHVRSEPLMGREDSGNKESVTQPIFSRYLIGAGFLFTALLAGALLIRSTSGPPSTERSLPEPTRPIFDIANTSGLAFSPDGNSVAFERDGSGPNSSGIYVARIGGNQAIQLSGEDDDCCPVWSPDGRWIAFSRLHQHDYTIHLVPADGGGQFNGTGENPVFSESFSRDDGGFALASARSAPTIDRTLDTGGVVPSRGEIDWSPDGGSIVFAGPSGIYLAEVKNRELRRITKSSVGVEEWGPRFSDDGKLLLFVRTHPIGAPDEVWTVALDQGREHLIFSEPGKIVSPPQWSFDGQAIIFSSNRTGHPALWRISLDSPDKAMEVAEAGSPAWDPAVSRRGYHLAYERLMRTLSIWQMDLTSADKLPSLLVSSTSNTDQGPGPQFSPDGSKLAYMSDRSGTMEIWISNRDGSNPYQLSAVGGAGTPRWSPDGQFVVFDTGTQRGSKIVAMSVRGGAPQILTPDGYNDVCPSWSRDGKWVYFASYRGESFQVWKVPASGGKPAQVTQHGGHAALESLDGKFLFYAKNQFAEPEIWRVPVGGGEENLVPLVRPGTWASWSVVKGGIIFVGPALGHQAVLSYYDFAKNRTTEIAVLDRVPFWLGAAFDGHTVAFDQPGREQSQAMMVENFR